MLRRVPRLHVDRSANRARRNRVHANPKRSNFLGDAFHHQHHATFGRSIIHMTSPWDDFVHRADANDFAGTTRDLWPDSTAFEFANGFTGTEKLAGKIDADHFVPLREQI